MAETTYNYWCFVKNESEKLSEGVTDSFTTEDLSNAVTFTISFGGTVSANMTEPLSELWTRIMGV